MAPWLRVLEAYLVRALLQSPAFHRGVEKVARRVHQIRHGVPPEEIGGTSIDQPGRSAFSKHFVDEVRTQLGYAEQKQAAEAAAAKTPRTSSIVEDGGSDAAWLDAKRQAAEVEARQAGVNARRQKNDVVKDEGSDAAWNNAQKMAAEKPKAGFMREYMDALKEQVSNGRRGR